MQSISTRYHGPTATRGSRISAIATGKRRITVSYDYGLSADENHDAAALALCASLGWGPGTLVRGCSQDERGNVYTFDKSWCRIEVPAPGTEAAAKAS